MDELRGPNIQIVLHVKEGLGFGFLRSPFIVSGSLNGYMLETDPVVPGHTPVFDAELVWEADKRRFRSLRVQNVPVKVEVYTMGTQGRKDKVGYLLLSLLGAQPCPSNKIIDVKYSWHRLLGVRPEGKCCHPQLMMSLSVEDRTNTPTPRNELRMFHSNEIAYPPVEQFTDPPPARNMLMTLNEYITESKKTVSSLDLQPKLLCDEGLIQIGSGKHHFVLSFVIGSVENIDLLLPEGSASKEVDCYVTYSVFTHNIMTDRVGITSSSAGACAQFNQRTSLRLASDLSSLGRYFTECPHVVAKICAGDKDVGMCSMDLRKLVPTEEPQTFLSQFCNAGRSLSIHERCHVAACGGSGARGEPARRPHVDVNLSLQYMGIKEQQKPKVLTARSATELASGRRDTAPPADILDYKSGSCTHLEQGVGAGYTNMAARNTDRYKNASGDSVLRTDELADLIKQMCESFTRSQERLLASRTRPNTSDMQVQCEPEREGCGDGGDKASDRDNMSPRSRTSYRKNVEFSEREPIKIETSKSDTCVCKEKEMVKKVLPFKERDQVMQKIVDELEDWKEKQQELFKHQLKRKEDYHLDLLSREWTKKRIELETKLSKGIEQCRTLAADLSRATDDFRLRGYRNTERERKLLDAKKGLEAHYTAKYQELREASQKMEDDMNHRVKMKDMQLEERDLQVLQLEKQVDVLKNNIKNTEKEADSKYSGLTKDQTASLIQELRCLEEKLDSAVQSKAFFKEQWGRAVRELHLHKLADRRRLLQNLHHQRTEIAHTLDPITDEDAPAKSPVDINKLKDDFYVDLLANTPALDTNSIISNIGPEGLDMFDLKNAPRNPTNERITELISQRESLIQQDSPDEAALTQLNHEIRNLLLNCAN